mmetsp:Transcript_74188/g.141295  ORF Transcript_74188/g.141295 Transcript_74188/m.141295 type:complete len:527 (-) Transcript_74188:45-1625(-)
MLPWCSPYLLSIFLLSCVVATTPCHGNDSASKGSCTGDDSVDQFVGEDIAHDFYLLQTSIVMNQTMVPLQKEVVAGTVLLHVEPEEAEEPADPIAVHVSWMLLGSICFFMAIFYLVNWPDEDIRWYSWEIIGLSLDIFVGVLVFDSLNGCLTYYAGQWQYSGAAKLPWAIAHMLMWIIVMQIVLMFVAGGHYSGAAPSKTHQPESSIEGGPEALPLAKTHLHAQELNVKCFSGILAHVAAFAAVEVCLLLQHHPFFSSSALHALLVAPIVFFFIWLIFMMMYAIRDAIIKRDGKVTHGQELWDEETQEAENDVISFAISFALVNALQFGLLGELPDEEELMGTKPKRTMYVKDILGLFVAAFFIGVAIIILSYLLGGLQDIRSRFMVVSVELLSMCFAWMLLGDAKVLAAFLDPNIDFEKIDVKIRLALVLTIWSFAIIIGLEKLAETMMRGGKMHQALVKVILSQGVLVGFSWEQCFFQAVENVSSFDGPWGQLACSMMLCAIVVPAYRYHILPKIVSASANAES